MFNFSNLLVWLLENAYVNKFKYNLIILTIKSNNFKAKIYCSSIPLKF